MPQTAIESFCDELVRRVPAQLDSILLGEKDQIGKQDLKQDPEQFVNQYLVWPICSNIGLEYISEWYHEGHGGSIDLYIRNTEQPVFGECKRLNHYKRAIRDVREYLRHRTAQTEFGIATDGISWLFIRAPVDKRKNVEVLEYHSFRGALFDRLISIGAVQPELEGERVLWNSSIGKVANKPYQKYGKLRRIPIDESVQTFTENFSPSQLSKHLEDKMYDETITNFGDKESEEGTNPTLDDFSK